MMDLIIVGLAIIACGWVLGRGLPLLLLEHARSFYVREFTVPPHVAAVYLRGVRLRFATLARDGPDITVYVRTWRGVDYRLKKRCSSFDEAASLAFEVWLSWMLPLVRPHLARKRAERQARQELLERFSPTRGVKYVEGQHAGRD